MNKSCTGCGRIFEWKQKFFPNIQSRSRKCRECWRKYQAKWERENKVRKARKVIQKREQRRKNPEYRLRGNLSHLAYYRRFRGYWVDYQRAYSNRKTVG